MLPSEPIYALTPNMIHRIRKHRIVSSGRRFETLEAGADGYVMKTETPSKILECIRQVRLGGAPMSSDAEFVCRPD
jgi:hypothetical protein